MAKKLNKKLIVTSNLKGKNRLQFVKAVNIKIKAATDNNAIVPDLDPTPVQMQAKSDNLSGLLSLHKSLQAQMKSVIEQISQAKDDITNDINSGWVPYVQKKIAGDESKAKLLGYGVKGIDNGHSDEVVGKASNSCPFISRIDVNVHLQHTVFILNTESGKKKLPDDARQVDIYVQIGGEPPIGIKSMTYLGQAYRGKFINNFETADAGKTVYYIAVYISKKTRKPLEESRVVSAMIN